MLAGAAAEDDGDAGLAGAVCGRGLGVVHGAPTLPARRRRGTCASVGCRSRSARQPSPTPYDARPLRPATVAVTAGRPPHEPDSPLNTPITMASTYVAGGDVEYGRYGNPTWSGVRGGARRPRGRAGASRSPPGSPRSSTVLDLVGQGTQGGRAAARLQRQRHAARRPRGARPDPRACSSTSTDTDAVVKACDGRRAGVARVADQPGAGGRRPAADHRRPRTRRAPTSWSTTPSPLPCSSSRCRWAPTSSCTPRRSSSPATATCCSARWSTADAELYDVLKKRRDMIGAVPGHVRDVARAARPAHAARAAGPGAGQRPGARTPARDHPAVGEVRYPGFGAIVSVVLAQGALAADLLTHKTRLWVHATSLGGVESTFERRRRWKYRAGDHPRRPGADVGRHRGRRRPLGRPGAPPSTTSPASPRSDGRCASGSVALGLGVARDQAGEHVGRGHLALDDGVHVLHDRRVDVGAARRGPAATSRTSRPRRPAGSRR